MLRRGAGVLGDGNGLLKAGRGGDGKNSTPKHGLDLGKENAREEAGDALAGPCQRLSWGHARARAAASHGSRASALRVCFAMRQ